MSQNSTAAETTIVDQHWFSFGSVLVLQISWTTTELTETKVNQTWTKTVPAFMFECWCSLGSVLVQFWSSSGSALSRTKTEPTEPKLNQLNQNWTNNESNMNQHEWFSLGSVLAKLWLTHSEPTSVVQLLFSDGSIEFSVEQFWFNFKLKAEPKLNQNWTNTYGSIVVYCWFSFGSVRSVSVQPWAEPKLNQLNQNWTNN